jgi:hypothetical protein
LSTSVGNAAELVVVVMVAVCRIVVGCVETIVAGTVVICVMFWVCVVLCMEVLICVEVDNTVVGTVESRVVDTVVDAVIEKVVVVKGVIGEVVELLAVLDCDVVTVMTRAGVFRFFLVSTIVTGMIITRNSKTITSPIRNHKHLRPRTLGL